MKKLNKKGFTLIEMLVVIAIIAILVAIIIPVVASATNKAAAATDAANLRSFKAEVVTSYLAADGKVTLGKAAVGTQGQEGYKAAEPNYVNCTLGTPAMKDCDIVEGCDAADKYVEDEDGFEITYDGSNFTITYAGKTVDEFAYFADHGSWKS